MATKAIVLYTTTRYLVKKFTCVSSPNINGCFLSSCFTAANYEILVYTSETRCYVILIRVILMLEEPLNTLWNGCFSQVPYFEPWFLIVKNQIISAGRDYHVHYRIIYLINMMHHCLCISILFFKRLLRNLFIKVFFEHIFCQISFQVTKLNDFDFSWITFSAYESFLSQQNFLVEFHSICYFPHNPRLILRLRTSLNFGQLPYNDASFFTRTD